VAFVWTWWLFGPFYLYSDIFFASIKLRFGWFGLVWAELCSSHELINILVSCIATLTLTRIVLIVHILCIRYAHYIVCCTHSVLKHCALRLHVRYRSLLGDHILYRSIAALTRSTLYLFHRPCTRHSAPRPCTRFIC
jgi:hypothetical protein